MGVLDWFKRSKVKEEIVPPMENVQAYDNFSVAVRKIEEDYIEKSRGNGKAKAYEEPLLATFSMNPDYKEAPSARGTANLFEILKMWSKKNIILNAIINTRVNQVSLFCTPARYSDRGIGYEVRMKDPLATPSSHDKANIKKIEEFLQHTGNVKDDYTRDNFRTFVKKLVRDRLVYDKINFELIYDSNGNLVRFKAVDASTIFVAVDDNGHEMKGKDAIKYVQILDNKKVAEFKAHEMAWEVHNPRTDVTVGRYGYPELEIAMNHLQYHENTEIFNARFFAQGGTTRGLLHIKVGQEQSHQALQAFRREWTNMFSGINGAWKIPVITAEDVKFVNMTQSSKDMEFEKWLNYLINVICSIYSIDPAEINFPNRGGATGHTGNTLNEGSHKEKTRDSKDKGLEPLLKFIEDAVNKYIVSQFGDKYVFNFVGGDAQTESQIIDILARKAEIGLTINDVREELGYPPIEGGDVILAGVHVQRLGQLMQEEQMKLQRQMEMNQFLAMQTGYNGDLDNVNGKGTYNKQVGKDGQLKGENNTNSTPQGGKGENGEPINDWKI
ncbi:phage portal protein [Collinsella aerofaciens]|uniref:phage portal protein n=1 Tax=Collinsella aerofaciens TaxID=74426 RepID=UPI001D00CBE3|nr:phage portal protein [Collinsella aerofaciens]MCB5366943.1 phage portal protein [Collinsella aerofaciens]MCB5369007.1 phage portal protein [Collinsella aerofaciens]